MIHPIHDTKGLIIHLLKFNEVVPTNNYFSVLFHLVIESSQVILLLVREER
jgi:hypothetical protein